MGLNYLVDVLELRTRKYQGMNMKTEGKE